MSNFSKTYLTILWILSVLLVVFALTQQDKLFREIQSPTAWLKKSSHGILTRSESEVRWKEALDKQGLFDGDWVASGPRSTTKVILSSGQVVELGEDTQIQIRAIIRENQTKSFLITLLRGSVFADLKSDCKNCPSITIKSDEKSFNVINGESVGIVKEIGKSMKKLSAKAPLPLFKGKHTAAMGVLESSFESTLSNKAATETVLPDPPEPVIKKPVVQIAVPTINLQEYIVKIQAGPFNKIMYTTDQKLERIKNLNLKIPLTLPYIPNTARKMIPEVRMFSETNKKGAIFSALPGETSVLLPIASIMSMGLVSESGTIKDYKVKLVTGLRLDDAKSEDENFKGGVVELVLRTLGDWNRNMIELAIDKLHSDPNFQNPWIVNKTLLSRESAPYRVLVYQANDLANLRSLIRGSGSLGINPVGSASNEGFFIIKDRRILGEISGSQINESFFRVITVALGAETVFKGKRHAFYTVANGADLHNSISKFLDEGKTIYILKKGKTYPVNREFVKSNAEVASFIDAQAKAVFLENVDIIYSM